MKWLRFPSVTHLNHIISTLLSVCMMYRDCIYHKRNNEKINPQYLLNNYVETSTCSKFEINILRCPSRCIHYKKEKGKKLFPHH